MLLSSIFLTILFSRGNNVVAEHNSYVGEIDPYVDDVEIMLINDCYETIWPGVHTMAGYTVTPTGFKLRSKDTYHLKVPDSWSGTIWARTGCRGHHNTSFRCDVGDCGTNHTHCFRNKPDTPATLFKFNLAPEGGISAYAIDLSDGFNLPAAISPLTSKCKDIQCFRDMRSECPDWLAMYDDLGEGLKIGCKSKCYTTGDPKDCCTGDYESPETCELNEYTQLVVNNCPTAVSNSFDESKFTCFGGVSYKITFCA